MSMLIKLDGWIVPSTVLFVCLIASVSAHAGFIDIAADEITYFDPGLETRCTGIQAFRDHLAPAKGTFSFPRYELLDPTVQLHGDIGILTFNFAGILTDGSKDLWNTTEVYRLIKGDWKLVSSHWSRTKPKP